MKIKITRTEDSADCETCGPSWACGYRVEVDDSSIVIERKPSAGCTTLTSYGEDHMIKDLLEYFAGEGVDVEFDYGDVSI